LANISILKAEADFANTELLFFSLWILLALSPQLTFFSSLLSALLSLRGDDSPGLLSGAGIHQQA